MALGFGGDRERNEGKTPELPCGDVDRNDDRFIEDMSVIFLY